MKGYKTTEFWMCLGVMLVGLVLVFAGMKGDVRAAGIGAALLLGGAAIYTLSRSRVKAPPSRIMGGRP